MSKFEDLPVIVYSASSPISSLVLFRDIFDLRKIAYKEEFNPDEVEELTKKFKSKQTAVIKWKGQVFASPYRCMDYADSFGLKLIREIDSHV